MENHQDEEQRSQITHVLFSDPQSLQSSSYNHFSAIYYLLLERVREHRSQQLSRQCGTWSQRPRSTSDSTGPEVSTTAGCGGDSGAGPSASASTQSLTHTLSAPR